LQSRRCPPSSALLNVHRLRFHELIEPMLAIGSTDAGLLAAGVEALMCLTVLTVDIRLTKLETARHIHRLVNVLRIERGRETIFGVVSVVHRFLSAIDNRYWRNGAKDLLAHDLHV